MNGYVEIGYGIAVLLDSHSSAAQKDGAVRNIGVGAAWFLGRKIGTAVGRTAAERAGASAVEVIAQATRAGARVGGILSIAVLGAYYELEFMANLYGQVRLGIGKSMVHSLRVMQRAGEGIAKRAASLAKAGILAHHEHDPGKKKALEHATLDYARELGSAIDSLLSDLVKPRGGSYYGGAVHDPGTWPELVEQFSEFQSRRGTTSPDAVAKLATRVLAKLRWCFEHADYLVAKAAGLDPSNPDKKRHPHHE